MEELLTKFVLGLSLVFQLLIFTILIWRRLDRRFRWFFLYIQYSIVEAIARIAVAANAHLYFTVYWVTSICSVALSVMALRESFLNVFRAYTRYRWFTRIVWVCVCLALLYSLFRAWAFPPIRASRLVTLIIDLELAVNYSLAFVGILYFALVKVHKIKEHQWESAIISGFATIGTVASIAVLTRAIFGPGVFSHWAEAVGYILAEVEWVVVLCRPEQETPMWIKERKVQEDDLTRLDQYSKILDRIWRGKS
jgi:hypothetical protein